ncbi:30S ribosomal protein S4 [bacterium]|nr:30S ribosomal protein S4 [FCB group bacterium]MBL7191557.1 30S ribosomal protein S4 [bacterium]
MARDLGAQCKICRREGEKLFLKGERCLSTKCAVERKNYPPGQHGKNRRFKVSEYGLQLREKQKIKRHYGLLERQFHGVYEKAIRMRGITGENMMQLLERRLDNVVYRMGLCSSRSAARQMVNHRHFIVNNRIVDIPSYILKPGDIIKVREKSKKLNTIHDSIKRVREGRLAPYLSLDKAKLEGELLSIPERRDIPVSFKEQLVVELYSK